MSIDVYGTGPLSYLWLKDGAKVGDGATYTVGAATGTNAGNYSVIVSNAYGMATSLVATVAINPAVPATITQQPLPRPVYPGGTASFSVAAQGTLPLAYQWQHAGTNMPGATKATLLVTHCTAAQAGAYTVGITNVAGGVLSSSAALTLITVVPGSYAEQMVTNSPVAYWRLNETSGTTAYDYAGGDDGAVSNSVVMDVPGPIPPASRGLRPTTLATNSMGPPLRFRPAALP